MRNAVCAEDTNERIHSDALVFFDAIGDLAWEKVFPSLQAMVKNGHLGVLVVGVAKAGRALNDFRDRARDRRGESSIRC